VAFGVVYLHRIFKDGVDTYIAIIWLEHRIRHGITAHPSLQCSNWPLNERVQAVHGPLHSICDQNNC